MKRKNQTARPKLIIIVLGLIPLIVLLYLYLSPKPVDNQSIFGADTCSAPCWFGLVPGESDYLDVEYLFQNRSDVFSYFIYHPDPVPKEDVMNGSYVFHWLNYTGSSQQLEGDIVIKDNIVDSISVFAPEIITLEEVIDVLGQPDDIQYFEFVEQDLYLYLRLIYADSLLVVGFKTVSTDCTIQSIEDDFTLETASYFSYRGATSIIEIDGTMQPVLTAYWGNVRQVPAELWQTWLSSEENMSCREAGRLLPETITPIDFPATP